MNNRVTESTHSPRLRLRAQVVRMAIVVGAITAAAPAYAIKTQPALEKLKANAALSAVGDKNNLAALNACLAAAAGNKDKIKACGDTFANDFNQLHRLEEKTKMAILDDHIDEIDKINKKASIGTEYINGERGLAEADTGETVVLTFGFINVDTLQPAPGPNVASVSYTVDFNPASSDLFEPLGISTDAAAGFGLPFTVAGYEPIVLATPLDANGNPVVIPGLDDDNIAVAIGTIGPRLIPEPRSRLLLAGSLLSLLAIRVAARFS